MIKRLVKLHIEKGNEHVFQSIFNERQEKIKSFDGCQHVELWQEVNRPQIFFTYSIWDSEQHLDAYRFSEFFKETWSLCKAIFESKAEAWSVQNS